MESEQTDPKPQSPVKCMVLIVFVIALMSVPNVLLVFRAKKPASGCAWTGLYWIFIGSIQIVLGTIVFNGAGGGPEVFLYTGLFASLCAGGVAIPLMVTRETGFQLTSPMRWAREQREG